MGGLDWQWLRAVRWRTFGVGLLAVVSAAVLVALPLRAFAQGACTWTVPGAGSFSAAPGSGVPGFCAGVLFLHSAGRVLDYCNGSGLDVAYGVRWPDGSDGVFAFTGTGSAGCSEGVGGSLAPWQWPISAADAGQILAACSLVLVIAWGLRQARKALD